MEISILISQYAKRFPFSSWMFAVSIAFVFVKPHIGNFTPPIPKKMSRVIFFFRQSFRNCYSLDCTLNNSQIHKFILILSYTSKRPVLLWQLCMQATWNSIFCDSTGPPPIPKKMSRVIYIFFQTKFPPPFNQYFNYVNLASLTLNFLRFLSEVSLSVHLPAFERVQRESYLSLIC